MTKYTKKFLEEYVKISDSFSDLVRKITKSEIVHGSMIAYIKDKLELYKIDFSHFSGRSWSKDKINPNTNLKIYLFKFNIKQKICEKCGLGDIWEGNKIVHQLDHKNGNKLDNRLDNIKLLCPNCHSQTPTYAGRKNKREIGDYS